MFDFDALEDDGSNTLQGRRCNGDWERNPVTGYRLGALFALALLVMCSFIGAYLGI